MNCTHHQIITAVSYRKWPACQMCAVILQHLGQDGELSCCCCCHRGLAASQGAAEWSFVSLRHYLARKVGCNRMIQIHWAGNTCKHTHTKILFLLSHMWKQLANYARLPRDFPLEKRWWSSALSQSEYDVGQYHVGHVLGLISCAHTRSYWLLTY